MPTTFGIRWLIGRISLHHWRGFQACNLKDFHAFGCLVYTLQTELASGKTLPHWHSESRIGLYLGPSPRHACNVGLVLNLETGLVSPQFHVSYDEFFETVQPTSRNPLTISLWQSRAGFNEPKNPIPKPDTGAFKKGLTLARIVARKACQVCFNLPLVENPVLSEQPHQVIEPQQRQAGEHDFGSSPGVEEISVPRDSEEPELPTDMQEGQGPAQQASEPAPAP